MPLLRHISLTAATAALVVAPTLGLGTAGPAMADTTVYAELVEQNRTGASGEVTLRLRDNGDLLVRIDASGLMPGPHAQHLHGSAEGGQFECATMDGDADGDGWLTNEEASGEYGNVLLSLTTRGDTGGESGLALDRMPTADESGDLTYRRTIPAAQLPEGLADQLPQMHVVQHGVDANDNDEYDLDGLGPSSFAAGLGLEDVPEEATNPASCGMVTGAGAGAMPEGGVATGTGTTDGVEALPLALGGAGLVGLGVLGLVLLRRHRRGAAG